MTYTEVVEYLKAKAIVVSPDCTFVHGKKPDASLISTNMVYPLIWLSPFRETVDRRKGNVDNQITIAFFAQDNTENTLIQRQALIQTMYQLKEAYMISLRAGIPMVAEITNESATPEYSALGGYVSGYAVNFKFTSKTAC
jgi:hypothetical protein